MNLYVNSGLSCVMAVFIGAAAADLSAQAQPAGTTANLGTVRIPRAVRADGQALPAGSYQVRLTETVATPEAPGQTPQYERWAEFLRNGKVVGREVVTIVPPGDIADVADMRPPPPGGTRVEMLKDNEYLRVWMNRAGTHYLIHLAV